MRRPNRKLDRTRQSDRKDAQDFILMDSHGRPVRLQSLLERGPAVISFYRGGWCPYCNIELSEFQQALPEIELLGASLVAISPELPGDALATEQKNRLTFPVLSDVGNIVAKRFGIVRKPTAQLLALYRKSQHRREGPSEFPIPSVFVIDQTRSIRMAYLEKDFRQHMAPAMAVGALKKGPAGTKEKASD
jgi:peroxiredoxin